MNKKLGLAVAGALVAFSSAANAGITIPAGDWTLDVGGVVNAYYTSTSYSGDRAGTTGPLGLGSGDQNTTSNVTTGLLPNYLSVSGKSRQNDLDIAFTISINPGASTTGAGIQSARQENRQAFLTIGDASWGSVKLGKDLGIFASDAILNDMTLLGVGGGAGSLAGNTTTLGRIGAGYMYADWKAQVAYTTPNWNGFQATVGITQSWDAQTSALSAFGDAASATSTGRGGAQPAFEAKAAYSWTGDVAGKVWASAISQKVTGLSNGIGAAIPTTAGTTTVVPAVANSITDNTERANAWDIGTNVNVAGFSLTGYYYQGNGIGQTMQLRDGFDTNGKRRDSEGYYVQATYALPTATKVGVSWGESKIDGNRAADGDVKNVTDSMWTVGAYHPLTKSVNLVAEYSESERDVQLRATSDEKAKAKTVSLGAILFF
jgi:predicted porin